MAFEKSWKLGLGFVLILCVVGVIYFGYYTCIGSRCALSGNREPIFKSNFEAYFAGRYLHNNFTESDLNKDYDIDLEGQDIIVFLHMQKTGGSVLGQHLVENLKVDPPCYCYRKKKKHCDCLTKQNEVWLFSRYSTGWRCGVHADWTELTACVDKWFESTYGHRTRRYHYITQLRDPVPRFISEWLNVKRGSTWKTATLKCNGREATLEEVPFCYSGEDWKGVSLEDFMNCPHNLAFNRQTRMMANLSLVNCYNTTSINPAERDRIMLKSAKENLAKLAFFGLVEFQTYTQFLFERSMHMNFVRDFVQHNQTHSSRAELTEEVQRKIAELNHLDIELYQFAKDLFLRRVKEAFLKEGLNIPEELKYLLAAQAVGGEEDLHTSTEGTVTSQREGVIHNVESVKSLHMFDQDPFREQARADLRLIGYERNGYDAGTKNTFSRKDLKKKRHRVSRRKRKMSSQLYHK